MANIQFFYNNLFDSATLTASSEDSDFPASNLQHAFRTKVWRTAGATAGTANLVIDHGSAKAVTAIILTNYNWASAPGTFDLEFNATDAWGAPSATVDLTSVFAVTPDTYGNRNVILSTFASKSYRYNRLNIVYSPGATPTDWDLGRIFIGTYFEPTNDYRYQHSEKIIDPSYISQSVGGQDHVDEISKYRTKDVFFVGETYAQWQSFQLLMTTVGFSKDLFVAFDPTSYSNEMTWYCKMTDFNQQKSFAHEIDMSFKESR
jgi:hypothetical protein